jgi:hypothetical protein
VVWHGHPQRALLDFEAVRWWRRRPPPIEPAARFCQEAPFPPGLINRVVESQDLVTDGGHHPSAGGHDAGPVADASRLVEVGLRNWFEMNLRSVGDLNVVPSILVHAAWQEFMRDPGSYSAFCTSTIGYDLPSVPALDVIPGEPPTRTEALRRAYEVGVLIQGSKARGRVPLIFRVDFEAGLRDALWWTWCDSSGDHASCVAEVGRVCARHVLHPRRPVTRTSHRGTSGHSGSYGGGGDGGGWGGWGDGGGFGGYGGGGF